MMDHNSLKNRADTYFYRVSKTALFFTALFSVYILYLVNEMTVCPQLAVKYYYAVPSMLKNVLLVCSASLAVGAAFEAGTN